MIITVVPMQKEGQTQVTQATVILEFSNGI